MSLFYPVLNGGLGECEHHIVFHSTSFSIFVLIHKFLNEIAGECYQKCLSKVEKLKYFL